MKTPKIAKTDGQHLIGIGLIEREQDGWNLVDELFVDSSGFGQPGEAALTIEQFYGRIKAGYGYGVVDAGQFQVYVGVFEKKFAHPRK